MEAQFDADAKEALFRVLRESRVDAVRAPVQERPGSAVALLRLER